jgi:electron transport complex protein RnfB
MKATLAHVLDALPQTQCTRCAYPDCEAYARAIVDEQAAINQCPPGGAEGIARLAKITGQPALPLNPEHGFEGPRSVAIIDEAWCIGCTLCIEACPTDAVLGSNKLMHTIIEPFCTGCELCLPVCPVDCISLEVVSGERTGWQAWSDQEAQQARTRYAARQARLADAAKKHTDRQTDELHDKLSDLGAHTKPADDAGMARKKAIIEAALARARAKKT